MYIEPDDYFTEDIRKKAGLGEYNEETNKEPEETQKEKDNKELRDIINNKK